MAGRTASEALEELKEALEAVDGETLKLFFIDLGHFGHYPEA